MAKKRFKTVLVSIYVNPKQFNSRIDFKSYPRNLKKDIELLKKLRVNYLYLPTYSDIYSFKTKKKIYLHNFSKELCGKFRPGHFNGVLNVVNRFLEIIKPKYIILGKKDFQQLFLINKLIKKNNIKSKLIPYKTIREKNGIACSSRNKMLNKKDTFKLSTAIKILKKEKVNAKKNKEFTIKKETLAKISNLGFKKIDYIKFLDLNTLKRPKRKNSKFNIFLALYLGKIRLIDNF